MQILLKLMYVPMKGSEHFRVVSLQLQGRSEDEMNELATELKSLKTVHFRVL